MNRSATDWSAGLARALRHQAKLKANCQGTDRRCAAVCVPTSIHIYIYPVKRFFEPAADFLPQVGSGCAVAGSRQNRTMSCSDCWAAKNPQNL